MKRSASLISTDAPEGPGTVTISDLPAEIKRMIAGFVPTPGMSSSTTRVDDQGRAFVTVPENVRALLSLRAVDKAFNDAVMTPEYQWSLKSSLQNKVVDQQLKEAKGQFQRIMGGVVDAANKASIPAYGGQHITVDASGHIQPVGADMSLVRYAESLTEHLMDIARGVTPDMRDERMRTITARMGLDGLIDWQNGRAVAAYDGVRGMDRSAWRKLMESSPYAWFSTLRGTDYFNLEAFRNLAERVARDLGSPQAAALLERGTGTMNVIRDRFPTTPSLERPFVAANIAEALQTPNYTRVYAPPGTPLPATGRSYVR